MFVICIICDLSIKIGLELILLKLCVCVCVLFFFKKKICFLWGEDGVVLHDWKCVCLAQLIYSWLSFWDCLTLERLELCWIYIGVMNALWLGSVGCVDLKAKCWLGCKFFVVIYEFYVKLGSSPFLVLTVQFAGDYEGITASCTGSARNKIKNIVGGSQWSPTGSALLG